MSFDAEVYFQMSVPFNVYFFESVVAFDLLEHFPLLW